ncbi:sigma-E factor negative regulatory protein [Halomonas sp.]|uniref:sigma-E factor negative regulatory protein n=1 Tax=Halomonas sp. TaxID=1486246 RepID=UPI0025BE2DBC|nr:sigma-E factor negative regulatory protein [Halomonas sp.]
MSQNARESLSALMDNEGDELELRRLLKTLDASPDSADAWRRYHLMRSLMRREPDVDVSTDLSAGIMARLKDEEPPQMDMAPPTPRRSLPLARSAGIAAAVSLMVITGVQFYSGGAPDGTQPGTVAGGSASQPAPASLASSDGTASRPSLTDLPLFQLPQGSGQGLMTVGTGGDSAPMFMAPGQRQSMLADEEQALLLQSYLDRHAEGAAFRSGDTWLPLLRASGADSLGQR